MKIKPFYIFLLFLITNIFFAQDRLKFVQDVYIKNEIEKSILFIQRTSVIPDSIKNKVIFITFDFEKFEESEGLSFTYSTSIPLLWTKRDEFGQFQSKNDSKYKFFNYSPNIILVFRWNFDYFNLDDLKKLSKYVIIPEKRLILKEFFLYNKGNDFTEPYVENSIILERNLQEFRILAARTFDLKTFGKLYQFSEVKVSGINEEFFKERIFNFSH